MPYQLCYGNMSRKPYLVTPNGDMVLLKYCHVNGDEGRFFPVEEIKGRSNTPKTLFSLTELVKMDIPLNSPIVKEHIRLAIEELVSI